MAKTDKKTERDLADRLRGLGLGKQLSKSIARTATGVKGQLPDSARTAIREMIAKVEDRGGAAVKKAEHDDRDADGTEKAGDAARKHRKKTGKKAKKLEPDIGAKHPKKGKKAKRK